MLSNIEEESTRIIEVGCIRAGAAIYWNVPAAAGQVGSSNEENGDDNVVDHT